MTAIIFAIAVFLLLCSLYLIFIKSKDDLKMPSVSAGRPRAPVVVRRPSSPAYDKITPLQEKIDELNIRLNKKDFEIKDKITQIANFGQQLNKKDFVNKQQALEISDLNQR